MSKLDNIISPCHILKDPNVQVLVAMVQTTLEGQNWTDTKLTEDEKGLVAMAVVATLSHVQ